MTTDPTPAADTKLDENRLMKAGVVLDAASKYMQQQYGIAALSHPIDRGRIMSDLLQGQEIAHDTDPDAWVDWKSQTIYLSENIQDTSGLSPVWFSQPAATPKL